MTRILQKNAFLTGCPSTSKPSPVLGTGFLTTPSTDKLSPVLAPPAEIVLPAILQNRGKFRIFES